jgi:hypothetical protein
MIYKIRGQFKDVFFCPHIYNLQDSEAFPFNFALSFE